MKRVTYGNKLNFNFIVDKERKYSLVWKQSAQKNPFTFQMKGYYKSK